MPTQNAAYCPIVPELTAVTVHEPLAEVTEPVAPVTAYPLQLVLDQLLPSDRATTIFGAVIALVRANAGLNAAKSISKPTKNADTLVEVFIKFHPFFV
jgi:hypothetical protein